MSDANLLDFLRNEDWDAPFFKRLAHNDTGQAVGHQAGMVIPQALRTFFPTLDQGTTSHLTPTTDRWILAEMYIGREYIAEAAVRYQIQTWGGTRPPESRITDGLKPLRDRATEGDVLVFQRRAHAFDRFRLVLIPRSIPEFGEIESIEPEKRWGVLFETYQPVGQADLASARVEIEALANEPFALIKAEVKRIETRQSKIARASLFREQVRAEYLRRCSVSGISLFTPTGLSEVEAAHVIPLSEGGTDDIRNGIALTQTLHWAFDQGLFGILPNRTVHVPRQITTMPESVFLRQFEGCSIAEAQSAHLKVHEDALQWHLENYVIRWE